MVHFLMQAVFSEIVKVNSTITKEVKLGLSTGFPLVVHQQRANALQV